MGIGVLMCLAHWLLKNPWRVAYLKYLRFFSLYNQNKALTIFCLCTMLIENTLTLHTTSAFRLGNSAILRFVSVGQSTMFSLWNSWQLISENIFNTLTYIHWFFFFMFERFTHIIWSHLPLLVKVRLNS